MMKEEMKQGEMREKAVKRTRRRKTETLFGNKYFVNKEYAEATELAERMMGGTEKIEAFICEIEAEIDIFLSTIINPNMVLRKYKHAYAILQFKKGVDRHIRFAGLGVLQANGLMPHSANYEIVYEKKLEQTEIPEDEQEISGLLEKLFTIFNVHHPSDFAGYSLSVGDIIAIRNLDTVEFFFVDSIGFKKLDKFGDEPVIVNAEMEKALNGIDNCIKKREVKLAELTVLTRASASENGTLLIHRDEMVKYMSKELSGMKKSLSQMREGDFTELVEFRRLKEEFEKSVESYYMQPED